MTTFSKGMHVIGCRHHKCNGCMIVHRSGKLRAICKRLSGRLIRRGRLMGTNRIVNLNNGAKHSANSRLRFRAHFLNVTVGPICVFSFPGRSVMTSACAFEESGNNTDDGANTRSTRLTDSKTVECRGIGDKSALSHVTGLHNISVDALYGLGHVAAGAVLHPKRILHYSWRGCVCL